MATVLLEPSVVEAEAVLKRLEQSGSMSREECHAVSRFEAKLRQGIAVERNAGGSEEDGSGMEEIAKALVGHRVRVATTHGSVKIGTLRRLSGFRTVILEDGKFRHPVNLSLVESIEVERAAA